MLTFDDLHWLVNQLKMVSTLTHSRRKCLFFSFLFVVKKWGYKMEMERNIVGWVALALVAPASYSSKNHARFWTVKDRLASVLLFFAGSLMTNVSENQISISLNQLVIIDGIFAAVEDAATWFMHSAGFVDACHRRIMSLGFFLKKETK